MKFRQYIPDHAVTTIPVLALMFAVHYFLLRDEPAGPGIELTDGAPAFYQHWQRQLDEGELDIDAELNRLELDNAERDRSIRELLQQKKYQQARTLLLEVAAAAVAQANQARFGDTLLLLGEVAINQQELAAAEIYLQEALYLSMEQDNPMGAARSYQLLGQLNIRARELARHASNNNDELWQARNAISRGYYQGVDQDLQRVIEENLSIRRYGAAADAWEALASLHDRVHDDYLAQQARIEAAKLYASTGQMTHVHRLIDGIDGKLISDSDLAGVRREIGTLFDEHQQDLVKTSQARDYQMLYHHYMRKGELERAWEFRIQASETLADTSDRALYQRQADVIAVLYNSNFAMDRARKYLDKAGKLYDGNGVDEMLQQTREMEALIY
ncbi:MAG: hypothetical protein OEU50_04690 [Gammaproteobacteria bacterium]|nr:hypothetical protein [Gammaproteobacteria bacterium]